MVLPDRTECNEGDSLLGKGAECFSVIVQAVPHHRCGARAFGSNSPPDSSLVQNKSASRAPLLNSHRDCQTAALERPSTVQPKANDRHLKPQKQVLLSSCGFDVDEERPSRFKTACGFPCLCIIRSPCYERPLLPAHMKPKAKLPKTSGCLHLALLGDTLTCLSRFLLLPYLQRYMPRGKIKRLTPHIKCFAPKIVYIRRVLVLLRGTNHACLSACLSVCPSVRPSCMYECMHACKKA